MHRQQARQHIKFSKLKLFASLNMGSRDIKALKRIFSVRCVKKLGIYLGSKLDFTRSKGLFFSRTLDQVKAKLSN